MKSLIVMLLTLVASLGYAEKQRANIQVGGDYPVYGAACRFQKDLRERANSVRTIEFQVEANNTLTIKTDQLSSGNCSRFAASDMPAVLQLEEGVLYEAPLNPKGASAIPGTHTTVFMARWVRQEDGTLYIYGGCSWKYYCGREGSSGVSINTVR